MFILGPTKMNFLKSNQGAHKYEENIIIIKNFIKIILSIQ
jgi:hypothetical protein